MKTNKFLLSGILGVALAGVVLTGCHKDSTTPASTDTDITAAQDESNGSDAANDSKSVSDAAMQNNTAAFTVNQKQNNKHLLTPSKIIYLDTNNATTDSLYINFGPTPVLCADARWRQGEIIVDWPKVAGKSPLKAYLTVGSTINMTYNNYYMGALPTSMYGIAGNRNWTNEGDSVGGYQNWDFTAALTITYPNGGGTATWNSTRNNTLIQKTTANGTAWYYQITGSASGVTRKGYAYSIVIVNGSPLYITAVPWWVIGGNGCPWIESGVVNITRTSVNNNVLSIDFGTLGNCTDIATATLNGKTYTILK